jgi:uncharacterized DUF497 family protein
MRVSSMEREAKFEFDPPKSALNKTQHGIDLVEAQAIWRDPDRVRVLSKKKGTPEFRFLIVGQIGEKLWTAVGTMRDIYTIRLVSCRRAHPKEEARYCARRAQVRPDG